MTKRTLALRTERLTELTAADLTVVVGAAQTNPGGLAGVCDLINTRSEPTIPDVNGCPTLVC